MKERTMPKNEDIEIDLVKLAGAYLKKWWLILLCGLLVAGGALLCTLKFITPLYRASVSVYVNNSNSNQQVDYLTSSNLDASQKLVTTYINISKSDRVMDLVVEELNGDYTTEEIEGIKQGIRQKLAEFEQESGGKLPMSVSLGVFYGSVESYVSIEKPISLADKEMFEEKQRMKKEMGITSIR